MDTKQALIQAVTEGNTDAVTALLHADPSLATTRTEAGLSLVLLATYYGRADMARLLAEHSPALDIFEASAIGRQDRVRELLYQDSTLANAFSVDGFTPLGLASFFGHPQVVDLLLGSGAQVNVASNNALHVMPLHSAVANRNVDISRALVEHGADVNATQQDGFTPLMEAAQNGDLATLTLLLQHGANPLAKNTNGQTALDLATAAGHTSIIEMLQRVPGNAGF